MTLKDARELARSVAGWCLDQDDLKGFSIRIGGAPDRPVMRVALEWPNAWMTATDCPLDDASWDVRMTQWTLYRLEAQAKDARERAARIADPNRLPG